MKLLYSFPVSTVGAISMVVVSLVLGSCRTRKEARIDMDPSQAIDFSPVAVTLDPVQFQWLDSKFNAEIVNNGSSNKVNGKLKIRNDSLIWASIRGAGIIEVFRIMASTDSVKVLNYLDKEYFLGDYKFLKSETGFNLTYKQFEAIFTGNPVFILPQSSYVVSVSGNDTILSTSSVNDFITLRNSGQTPNVLFQALWVGANNRIYRNVIFDPSNKVELEVKYSAFDETSGKLFPMHVDAKVVGDSANLQIQIDYSGLQWDKPGSFPFSIPNSYKRIEP